MSETAFEAKYWDALDRIRDLGDRDANLQGRIGALEADLAATRDKLREAEAELRKWEEREAACCPEDVGFPECIEQAQARIAEMKQAADEFAAGTISAGKLGEVLGADDVRQFKTMAHAFCEADEKALPQAQARIAALEQVIRVIGTCVTDAKYGEFWTARKWLDTRGVYHDNLSGLRVVEEVCKTALKPQADARGREEER